MNNIIKRILISWPCSLVLLILYLLAWKTDQGIDVMISLTENHYDLNSFGFLFLALFFTIAIWYVSFAFESYYTVKYKKEIDKNWFYPSALGSICILIIGYAIVNAADAQFIYKHDYYLNLSNYILSGCILCLLFLSSYIEKIIQYLNSEENYIIKKLFVFALTVIGLIPFMIIFYTKTTNWYYYFALVFSPLCFAILFLFISNTYFFIDNLAYNKNYIRIRRPLKIIYILSSSFSIIFIAFSQDNQVGTYIGPFNCVLAGLMVPSLYLKYLNLLIIKFLKPAWFLIFPLLVFGINKLCINNSKNTDQIELISNDSFPRPSVDDYILNWITELECKSDSNIYLVASKGGGIRAAYWTNLVLANYMKKTEGKFFEQCLLLTGSSGGMVGQGLFFSFCNSNNNDQCKIVKKFYENEDFLSPLISRIFGYELFINLFSLNLNNRHEVLENIFISYYNQTLDSDELSNPYLHQYTNSDKKNLPLLISTSYDCMNGRLALISPVKFNGKFKNRTTDFLSLAEKSAGNRKQPSLISGILQSARFPLVSPKGRLKTGEAFMDAGMIDNVGAMVAEEVLDELKTILNNNPEWKQKFIIKVIIIENESLIENLNSPSNKGIVNDVSNIVSIQSNKRQIYSLEDKIDNMKNENIRIQFFKENDFAPLNINLISKNSNQKVIYPLGWSISEKAQQNIYCPLTH